MASVQAGQPAPDFELPASTGETIKLSDLRGKYVVLYFYPRDNTPGCTKEACSFRDEHSALQQAGAVVLGVSTDSIASHQRFAQKYELPFPLLADTEKQVAEQYGVWVEKNMYGRKTMGMARTTFLIGPDGVVVRVWQKVKPEGHAKEVLEALQGS